MKVFSHLESLVSLGMVLMLGTCGGGTWHILHGQGIPVPTPQCWKLLPRGPAAAAGALRSPWWGLTDVTAEMAGADRDEVETGGRSGWCTAGWGAWEAAGCAGTGPACVIVPHADGWKPPWCPLLP